MCIVAICAGMFACGGGSSGGSTTTTGGGTGGGSTTPTPDEVLYVASGDNGQGEILAFPVTSSSGKLGASTSFNAPEYLYQITADPTGKFLYASDFDMGAMRAYSIQASTGALSEVSGSPFVPPQSTGNAGPFAITPDGKFVFYAVYNITGDIVTFSADSGTLTPTGAIAHDDGQPFQMAVDPSGKFLYVTDHGDNMVNGQVSVFSIDSTGTLTEIAGSPFDFQSDNNEEPNGLAIHPNGKFVYLALTNANAGIDTATINAATGALTLIPGSPFIPGSSSGSGYMAMNPAGTTMYVTGNGVAQAIAIDPSTGNLTPLNSLNTEPPVQIVVDTTGKNLFGSITPFKSVASYPIDTSGNAGTPTVYAAGVDPGALAIVKLQ
jgi:6-phosphogluconolactonase (cycloisomerase 2 family)